MAETKYYLNEAGLDTLWNKINKRDQEILSKILANTNAISVLNGEADTTGSVANLVAEEIAKVVAGAPEDLDTLKEIADWIEKHPDNVSEINSQLQQQQKTLDAVTTALVLLTDDNGNVTSSAIENVDKLSSDVSLLKAVLWDESAGLVPRVNALETSIITEDEINEICQYTTTL